MRLSRFVVVCSCLLSFACAFARAETLFDPQRHMHVSEVRPGMKGYGLSVFKGTKIEKFDVEVISVLHNFNPKYDVVLIRCHGAGLEHSGAIAGMSGSPIFLRDDEGRDRMIGAFAYGWPLVKDPIAGVQPIEYMLNVGSTLKPDAATTQQTAKDGLEFHAGPKKLVRYDPLHPPLQLGKWAGDSDESRQTTQLMGDGDVPQLRPLATPLMVSGISPRLMEKFAPLFKQYGLVALQAGGISGSVEPSATTQPAELEPGSVLAAPLLTGDVELTAIGTCTERIGNRIFGFGHPFNNEGPITLPMGAGYINGIIPSLTQSFKLGAMTQLRGALIADQVVGVAGKVGKPPPTIPVDLHVIYTDGSLDTTYHFEAASHPKLTPLLSGVAIQSALSGQRDLPQYHTVQYDLNVEFANGKSIPVKNVAVNTAEPMIFTQVAGPIIFAAENPFERVMLKKITGTIRVTPEAHQADILSVNLPKQKYRPGETLKAFVRYRPFRAEEAIMPIELTLPRDLRDGTYQLSISDQSTYIQQEELSQPFRFSAESIDDVFSVLKDISSIRQDALYVQLLKQADGVAIGRTALKRLPSSRRQVLLDAGLSNVTPFMSAATKIIPTDTVMNGSAQFQIEIDAQERVEVGGKTPAPGSAAPGGAAGKEHGTSAAQPGENKPGKPAPAPPANPKPEPAPGGPKTDQNPSD